MGGSCIHDHRRRFPASDLLCFRAPLLVEKTTLVAANAYQMPTRLVLRVPLWCRLCVEIHCIVACRVAGPSFPQAFARLCPWLLHWLRVLLNLVASSQLPAGTSSVACSPWLDVVLPTDVRCTGTGTASVAGLPRGACEKQPTIKPRNGRPRGSGVSKKSVVLVTRFPLTVFGGSAHDGEW